MSHLSYRHGWALKDHGDGHVELFHATTMRSVIRVRSDWERALGRLEALPDAPLYLGGWDFDALPEVIEARREFREIDTGEGDGSRA